MSLDDEQKSPMLPDSNHLKCSDQPEASHKEETSNAMDRQEKALELLKKLRGFVSNPAADFKSKINNIITPATKAIEKYRGHRDLNICLDTHDNEKYSHVDLREEVKKAKVARMEIEKSGILSPKIFQQSAVLPQATVKAKLSKNKSTTNVMKTKTFVSVLPNYLFFLILRHFHSPLSIHCRASLFRVRTI